MGELGLCTVGDIVNSTLTLIISDITTDSGVPLLLVRLFHNKVIYSIFLSLRCYFLYFDTIQISRFISGWWLPLIFYTFIERRWRKYLFVLQLIFPLLFLFNPLGFDLGGRIMIFSGYYMGLGIIGILKLFFTFTYKMQKN